MMVIEGGAHVINGKCQLHAVPRTSAYEWFIFYNYYHSQLAMHALHKPGAGLTKTPFGNFSIKKNMFLYM